MPETPGRTVERPLLWLVMVAAAVAIALLTWLSVTHLRLLTYDSMNYVDVARNIARGRGIVQSTAGFNETRLFSDLDPAEGVRRPLTSQPPVYPLAIAALATPGIDPTTAALLIAAFGFGLTLAGLFLLGRELHDTTTGAMAMASGLAFVPLRAVASNAWSETLAIGLWLVAMALVVRVRHAAVARPGVALAAGIVTGLAFATRYAFAIAPAFAVLALIASRGPGRSARGRVVAAFLLGFVAVAAPLVVRNVAVGGHMLGPPRNPSTIGWTENARKAAKEALGVYLGDEQSRRIVTGQVRNDQQDDADAPASATVYSIAAALAIGLLALAIALRRRRDTGREMADLFGAHARWLPLAWGLGYLGFVVWQRSQVHFDPIDTRLAVPGTALLVIPVAALLVRALNNPIAALVFALALSGLVAVQQGIAIASSPRHDPAADLAESARLRWIDAHTTDRDLIVGVDTLDVPYRHPGRVAVSFSAYPYTNWVDHRSLFDWVCPRASAFDRIYLIIRGNPAPEARFGPFVSDVLAGRGDSYAGVRTLEILDDATVASIDCAARGSRPW